MSVITKMAAVLLGLAGEAILQADVTLVASVFLNNDHLAEVDHVRLTKGEERPVTKNAHVHMGDGASVDIVFYAKPLRQSASVTGWINAAFRPSKVQAAPMPPNAGCVGSTSASLQGRYTFKGPGDITITADKLSFG